MKVENVFFLIFLILGGAFVSCVSDKESDLIDSCENSNLAIEVASIEPVTCESQGSIEVVASGGTGSYEFSIDDVNYQTTGLFSDLNAGAYTLSVRDIDECLVSVVGEVVQSDDAITLAVSSSTPSTCGQTDGSILLTATGGEGILLYRIGTEEFQESAAFDGLVSGEYDFEAKDDTGCSAFLSATVESASGDLVLTVNDITEAGCGTPTGSVTLAANGGDENYRYKLGDGEFQDSPIFEGLSSGDHDFSVIDGNTCENTASAEVLPPVTLSADVFSVISSNCATSGCHNGSRSPNLSTAADIIQSANRVKVRTSAGTMPPSGSLSQAQIDAIACWVDDGAKDN